MMSTLCLNPLCQFVCKGFYCNENKKVTLRLTTEKQTTVVQRMSEEGVGEVSEALLISLEWTNTLSAYVYRDIRYNTHSTWPQSLPQSYLQIYTSLTEQTPIVFHNRYVLYREPLYCTICLETVMQCFFRRERGVGLIVILFQGRHSKRPKIGHVSDDVILLIKLLPEKEYYRVLFFVQNQGFCYLDLAKTGYQIKM